ncbi:MAG: type IX secretion system sortase PorU, partial [Leeuwenhoekiella sp.]
TRSATAAETLSSANLAITNSVLASGDFYKFYVDKTGVFKIDKAFLNSLGMNVNAINPNKLKVFGNGGAMLPLRNEDNFVFDPREVSIKVVGGEDNSFDNNDYILFYGEGTSGFNTESLTHINAYDDRSYYFITADGVDGKRVSPMQEPSGNATQIITTFDSYKFHEVDQENLLRLGRRWFGERFDFENEQHFTFSFPNIVTTEPVKLKVYVAAISDSQTAFELTLNNESVSTIELDAISDAVLASDNSYNTFQNGTNSPVVKSNSATVDIGLNYLNNGNPSSVGYLDFIGVEAVRDLKGAGKQMPFQKNNTASATGIGKYIISEASQFSEVWDVTKPTAILSIENTEAASSLEFNSQLGSLHKFVALNPSDFYTPLIDNGNTRVANQNLKGTIFNGGSGFKDVDYLMITGDLLKPQAEKLAQHNRTYRGLNVKVVTLNEIYNEFNSGTEDIGAIRNFVRYVYENASSAEGRLKYLCLFGDTSIDYKDRLPGNNNIIPTFNTYYSFSQSQSFMSDDFYGVLDPAEGILEGNSPAGSGGGDKLDVAVGRILADTPQLANEVVDKIINYDAKSSYGRWRNNFVLISDDVDFDWEFKELESTLDELGDQIHDEKPFINVTKIHSDSYQQESSAGGDRYPQVNDAISDAIEVGALVVTYLGHGGEDALASEFIFTRLNAETLNNEDKLPVIVTVTCEFTRFDNPTHPAAGEELFWNANGGAVGLVATTREISVSLGVTFNERLAANIFSFGTNTIKSVAENLRETKNEISDSKRRVIFYIGDPAMKLAFAQPDIRLTSINDAPVTQATDTLKALSKIKMSGEILTPQGQLINDYTGKLAATVYDKDIDRQTLGNDGTRGSDGNLLILNFQTLGNILYRGQASVVNGKFDFEFVVPKDALIPLGKGRVSFYAERDDILENSTGVDQTILIGGLNEDAPEDNEGPVIQAYMNDESFVNGGITNTSPFLLVKLEDVNGINTSSGIGHDLVAILDGDETNPIILNDFYESDVDNFALGKALRKLRDLEPGLHTVTVIAWDTYNNSSTVDLQFVVAGDEEMKLENVLNYPNPFVNYTEFWFNHNRPYEPLDVQVQIFTVSGKIVKTINQNIVTTGFLSRDITWDGRDDFGDRIGKGVYVYKITVKSTLTNKQVEKFEKLVIL